MEKQATKESLPFAYSTGDDSGISLITIKVDGEIGSNDWYTNDIGFNFTSESEDISTIYYNVYNEGWAKFTEPFFANEDGKNICLEWYAVDNEGNQSEVDGPFCFKMDQTPPEIDWDYEWSGNKPPYILTFTANATDATSGMERAEFYINGELQETVYGHGPEYVYEMVYYPHQHDFFRVIVYDMAGNFAYDDHTPSYNIAVLESSMFQNDISKECRVQSYLDNILTSEIIERKNNGVIKKSLPGDYMGDVFDPAYVIVVLNRKMGENGWIVSNVSIPIFYKSDRVADVYYKFNDGGWMLYTEPQIIYEDGLYFFSWYVVDSEGYTSTADSISFKIDRTPPKINLIRERLAIDEVKFIADVYDETSNIDRVEFSTLDYYTDYNFPYEWIYYGFGYYRLTAIVYDKAGNSNSSSLSTWRSKNDQQSISMLSSQRVMNAILSTENIIENIPACSCNKDASNISEQKSLYDTILYTFMGGFMGTGFYAFGPGNITRFREWEGYPYSFFSAGTWTNDGRWLCCMYNNGTLYEVNPKMFDAYAIGDGGDSLNGLAYDPVTEKLYGASSNILYEIDMETGEQEYRGFFGSDVSLMIAIAFDANGVLYGWDLGDKLWTIDTETGEATEVGPLGINLNYAQDGDFDKDEDILYLAAFTLSPSYGSFLYECDEDTGECKLVGTLGDGFIEIGAWTISYELNMEPPVTTPYFDPLYPDGYNGWYASNVTVTLNATDNTGVIATYYRIDAGEWKIYVIPFMISEEGEHTIEYYSYDYVGNIEDVKLSTIYIDKIPPDISLEWETYKENTAWRVKFIINANDEISGIDRIEMYINDELYETITYPGPIYNFIIKWISEYKNVMFKFVAYDIAGNSAFILINGSDIKSHPRIKSSTYQTVNIWLLRFLDRFPFIQRLLTLHGWINL